MELEKALARFETDRKLAGNRPTTIERRHQVLFNHFLPYAISQGVTDSMAVDPGLIRGWLAHRMEVGGVKAVTAQGDRGLIVGLLGWWTLEGLAIDTNWGRRITNIRYDKTEPRCLSPEQLAAFIEASDRLHNRCPVHRYRDRALVRVLADTGMRLGECLRLDITDIDLEKRTVRISEAAKSRKGRTAYFSEATGQALAKYLETREREEWSIGDPKALWASENSRSPRLSDQQTRRIVGKIAAKAGLTRFTPHCLRHTCCTQLLRSGMAFPLVSRLMGHSDLKITSHYLHLIESDAEDAYAACVPAGGLCAVGQRPVVEALQVAG